jgi:hypothetical protein
MILFDFARQKEYQKDDVILELLNANCQENDDSFVSHRWLVDSLPKRMIYWHLYGDLIQQATEPQRILDVGGGYCALSRLLVQKHDYTLLDIMAHDDQKEVEALEKGLKKSFWVNADWYQFEIEDPYDFIVANDLFPNVDQRLELFIEKFLPSCREMRLSLTCYNYPRFYHVKRLDADEVLCLLAWDGIQVRRVLEKYVDHMEVPNLDVLADDRPSLFANKRQVYMVNLRNSRRTASWSNL